MEKIVAVVLTVFVVLPMITADKPLVVPKTRLIPAKPITGDTQFVNCPGGRVCADDYTCCMTTSGSYGCCPEHAGNCCSDYSSCCPSGYVCDKLNDGCLKVSITQDTFEKLPFLKK